LEEIIKNMTFPLSFLIPAPQRFRSGGNHYNQQLLRALRRLGIETAAAEEVSGLPGDGPLFVDTLLAESPLPPQRPRWLIVHHLRSLYPPKGWSSKAYFAEREAAQLRSFDGFLASSPFTAEYLRQSGLTQPCIVAEPGLSNPPSSPLRNYDHIQGIMVANLVERKGVLPFLQQLRDAGPWPNFQFRLFGEANLDKSYATECLSVLESLEGIVQYEGARGHEAVLQAYYTANLLLSASFMETYGMALQEGAAHGLPLLLREGGHAARHAEAGNGRVCKSIAEMISWLQRWQADTSELQALGAVAHEQAAKRLRSWEDTARDFWQQLKQHYP
jgi:hypothetical protein